MLNLNGRLIVIEYRRRKSKSGWGLWVLSKYEVDNEAQKVIKPKSLLPPSPPLHQLEQLPDLHAARVLDALGKLKLDGGSITETSDDSRCLTIIEIKPKLRGYRKG